MPLASKYAGLKGRIPEAPQTPRAADIAGKLNDWKDESISSLTEMFNGASAASAALAAEVKKVNATLEALEILIRQKLEALEGDAISVNGYTWSPKFEPYPVCDNPQAVVQYFRENDMESELVLTNTELASRLKTYIKEEALNNELQITTREEVDPITGDIREVPEVRSKIPGVKVFLKPGLSRAKSKGAK
jgi:hypothetical protein